MTIGEKLTEARTRKGISIREAAEATKIRGEYLSAMEENTFAINLPEIYKRGFLRNYARFLKLDPDKLMADYGALQISRQSSVSVRGDREMYGRIELPRQSTAETTATESTAAATPARSGAAAVTSNPRVERSRTAVGDETDEPVLPDWLGGIQQATFIKILIGVGGVSVLILLLAVLISIIRGGSSSEPVVNQASPPSQSAPVIPAAQPVAETGQLVIRANASVTLLIENRETRERLFTGTLNAGEATPTLRKTGPLSVRFTEGEAIIIELNGQQIRPERSGIGQMLLP
ncbi:MAG: helix-turn-helix domain-containing protein [Verrucomicrobia bacterium]|nr:helix-turn-helix domain-containing protein [Verrucomicrobiota bacterium]